MIENVLCFLRDLKRYVFVNLVVICFFEWFKWVMKIVIIEEKNDIIKRFFG